MLSGIKVEIFFKRLGNDLILINTPSMRSELLLSFMELYRLILIAVLCMVALQLS